MRKIQDYQGQDSDLCDRIILSVKTKGFESQVEVPIPIASEDLDKFVLSWLEMMRQALKMPHNNQDQQR